ncbi:LacI family DNA-binding transcriptional regulator [Sporosarcina thermotolerans]|uniref:Catabolite control protein A n=1 Tax=Sporosarcina thermotolerans TaxID=633404 RepID=A0AAW9A8L5_9BACL|nr:LacI family DNA-binding transcriptional regulator [Sporosarcina thermotolerans]MDW0116215.1 LacI family DNA-binding transcriptional regulator [Sporosarcina thermotolerans]WHT48189.1 LacI family DNA-binding transcriptional regulator [Sporosarcina thermotolerans]
MKNKVTIKDVAKYAGVSPSTVSRVLNNYLHIKPDKRQKVEEAIKELNFEPNEIARSLITNKSKTIGLVVDDISNPFFSETSKVIILKARQLGYEILIYDTSGEEDLKKTLKFLLSRNLSGIIVGSVSRYDQNFEELVGESIPVVYFNRKPEKSNFFSVTMDNKKGSKMTISHLIQKGHSRIAFIGGPFEYSTYYDRYLGYYESINEFGLTIDEELILKGKPTNDYIQNFVTRILSKPDRPTAIVASTDQIAITVLDAIEKNNFRVPNDVAVIGFDNIQVSSNPYIGLTTISQQKSKMAELALNTLILLIEKNLKETPEDVVISPKLITRKTT